MKGSKNEFIGCLNTHKYRSTNQLQNKDKIIKIYCTWVKVMNPVLCIINN